MHFPFGRTARRHLRWRGYLQGRRRSTQRKNAVRMRMQGRLSIAGAAPIRAPNHRQCGNGIRILRRAALAQDDRKNLIAGSSACHSERRALARSRRIRNPLHRCTGLWEGLDPPGSGSEITRCWVAGHKAPPLKLGVKMPPGAFPAVFYSSSKVAASAFFRTDWMPCSQAARVA